MCRAASAPTKTARGPCTAVEERYGITLALGEGLMGVEAAGQRRARGSDESGNTYLADIVILAVGVKPAARDDVTGKSSAPDILH